MHHPTRHLTYGFIIILTMMVSLALIAFYYTNKSSDSVSSIVTAQLEKVSLINELSTIINNRTRFIQTMLLHQDRLTDSEAWSDINHYTGAYNETRRRLIPLLAPREKQLMQTIDKLDEDIAILNKQVSVLLLNDSQTEAGSILLREVLPKTAPLLANLSELTQLQRLDVEKALLMMSNEADKNRTQLTIYAIFSILVSLAVAIMAIVYGQKLSAQLQDINSYLEEKIEKRTESLLDTQKSLLEDNSKLSRLALTDTLTGLSNRAHMNQILQKEYSRYLRHNHRFGIILIDFDHFKEINDNYGHDRGDQVLIQLSRKFEQAIRNSDYLGRWGGEEFMICSTTISENHLFLIAENIRKIIFHSNFDVVGQITVSLGCALIQVDENIDELTKRADVALYVAKNNGRNQTVVSDFVEIT